jgi:hypothetical protein
LRSVSANALRNRRTGAQQILLAPKEVPACHRPVGIDQPKSSNPWFSPGVAPTDACDVWPESPDWRQEFQQNPPAGCQEAPAINRSQAVDDPFESAGLCSLWPYFLME